MTDGGMAMHIVVSLTVSESKRLIGKGVTRSNPVRRAAPFAEA